MNLNKENTNIFSNSETNDNSNNIIKILEECSSEIVSNLDILHQDLLFLKHGFNLVIGESKSGKTFTTIKSLVDASLKDEVIHIDFDRNADEKLKDLGVRTYHINDAKQLFDKLKQLDKIGNLNDKILVIDSLQDLGLDEGIDTNSAALNTMNRVKIFGETGATIIVIHHITLKEDGEAKIKGNATTISSKADTTLLFSRIDNIRTMKVQNTRAEDKISTGTELKYDGISKQEKKYEIPA